MANKKKKKEERRKKKKSKKKKTKRQSMLNRNTSRNVAHFFMRMVKYSVGMPSALAVRGR